jgi:hypothetical protein
VNGYYLITINLNTSHTTAEPSTCFPGHDSIFNELNININAMKAETNQPTAHPFNFITKNARGKKPRITGITEIRGPLLFCYG